MGGSKWPITYGPTRGLGERGNLSREQRKNLNDKAKSQDFSEVGRMIGRGRCQREAGAKEEAIGSEAGSLK